LRRNGEVRRKEMLYEEIAGDWGKVRRAMRGVKGWKEWVERRKAASVDKARGEAFAKRKAWERVVAKIGGMKERRIEQTMLRAVGTRGQWIAALRRFRVQGHELFIERVRARQGVEVGEDHFKRRCLLRLMRGCARSRGARVSANVAYGRARVLSGLVRRTFAAWKEHQIMQGKAVDFFTVNGFVRGFDNIRKFAVVRKVARRNERIAANFGRGIILLRAFCGWQVWADNVVVERRLRLKSLLFYTNTILGKVFGSWKSFARESQARVTSPDYVAVTSGVFDCWLGFLEERKRKNAKIARATSVSVLLLKSRGMAALRMLVSARREERSLLDEGRGEFERHCLERGVTLLRRFTVLRRRRRDVWNQVVEFDYTRLLKNVFQVWSRAVVSGKRARRQSTMLRRKALIVCFEGLKEECLVRLEEKKEARRRAGEMFLMRR